MTTITELRDSIDAARIANKLNDANREVAFVVNAIENLAACHRRMTRETRDAIRNHIRAREYTTALTILEGAS